MFPVALLWNTIKSYSGIPYRTLSVSRYYNYSIVGARLGHRSASQSRIRGIPRASSRSRSRIRFW